MEYLIDSERSIIPALDVRTLNQLATVVSVCSTFKQVYAYKVGFSLALRYSLPVVVSAIKRLDNGAKVIYDYQKAGTDIPDVAGEFAAVMKESGVDAAIIFPQAGPVTQEAFIKALQDAHVHVICGGEMTHKGYLVSDGGYIADDAPEKMYRIAAKLGIRDFVVPGNKVDRIKLYQGVFKNEGVNDVVLYSPGFINQDGKLSDATKVGGKRWHAIVGRAVYNPRKRQNLNCVTKKEIHDSLETLVANL